MRTSGWISLAALGLLALLGPAAAEEPDMAVAFASSNGSAPTPSTGPLGREPQSWICEGYNNGSVIQGLVSLLDRRTGQRRFRLMCVNLLEAGLRHYPGLEWQGREWQWVRRRLDVPEPLALAAAPASWALAGCRGHEILVGLNSVRGPDGVQRYELLCVEYLSVRVASAACGWRRPTDLDKNFLLMTPPGEPFGPYVFNAVRSVFDEASGDRSFELRACAAYTVPEWPGEKSRDCKFSLISSSAEDLGSIQGRVFSSYRTSDVQECAKICANHWFCYTFMWQPSLSRPSRANCRLSYRPLARAEVCAAAEVWHSGLSHLGSLMDDPDVALVFPCFQCLSLSQANSLFSEKDRLRRLLI